MPKRGPLHDLSEKRFGELKVLSFAGMKARGAMWTCQCMICRTVKDVRAHDLLNGDAKSCGCQALLARNKRGRSPKSIAPDEAENIDDYLGRE